MDVIFKVQFDFALEVWFSIVSEILIRFYYDQGASTTLLLRSCRFCYDSCYLTKISNRSGIAVQWNGGGGYREL